MPKLKHRVTTNAHRTEEKPFSTDKIAGGVTAVSGLAKRLGISSVHTSPHMLIEVSPSNPNPHRRPDFEYSQGYITETKKARIQ